MSEPSALGPYLLREPLGRGGMGEVREAIHRPSGARVAIKLLAGEVARGDRFAEALLNEVRAVAALDHPHVVAVLDLGRGPDGAPYVVMEHVEGATLAARPPSDWPALRRVLRELLDALAHAHARGVVHRDLKPANVMLDARGAVRLLDFGLARLQQGDAPTEVLSGGTPSYTAPEQFVGRVEDQGPWTDLYALGCLAWRLLTGRGPFPARGWSEAMRAHLEQPLPPLVTPIATPAGLEGWLRRLLQKAPADRFRRAADAAWGLACLGEVAEGPAGAPPPLPDAPTLLLPTPDPAVAGSLEVGGPAWAAAPPIPPAPESRRAPIQRLPGAGLGLYGLRAVPVVGREDDQAWLWGWLRALDADRRPRAVLLRGPTGVGKTRLAEWLTCRAHELGAAEVLRVACDPAMGPACGLGPALARLLGPPRSDPAQTAAALAGWGPLAAPLADALHDRLPAVERRGVIASLLRALARDRAVLVHVDDAPFGADAVALAREVVARGEGRIGFLLTGSDEALAASPLAWTPEARDLTPLDEAGRRALVRELLGLDGELAAQIEQRTGGNPLFAVQLVGDWVRRGLLRPHPAGYRLAPGARVELPDGLRELGEPLLRGVLGPGGAPSLEVAALLGLEVDGAEWRAACAALGVAPDREAVGRLVEARLARCDEGGPLAGFAFTHGVVRELLAGACRERGRAEQAHRACARVVSDPIRRGLHQLAAGDDAEAVESLLRGVEAHGGDLDQRRVTAPLTACEQALDRLGAPPSDPRRAEVRLHLARAGRLRGAWVEAESALAALVADAGRFGWSRVGDRARIELAHALRARGRPAEALAVLEQEVPLDEHLRASWRLRRALALYDLGRLPEAAAEGDRGLAWYEERGDALMAAHARITLSMIALAAGDDRLAERRLREARAGFEAAPSRAGLANVWNNLGEVYRGRGDREAAERAYRASLEGYELLSAGHAVLPRVNLAVLWLDGGAADRALPVLEEAADELGRQGRRGMRAVVEVARMRALVEVGDLAGAERALGRAEALWEGAEALDPDAARWAREAAERWGPGPAAARAARLGGP